VTLDPDGAPGASHAFAVTDVDTILADSFETDLGWTVGSAGDDATGGVWVREEPVGTIFEGYPIQPDLDATPDPGEICFVTENGEPGGLPAEADVDNGRTTVYSPVLDLSGRRMAFVSYSLWFSNQHANTPGEDFWIVRVTSNGSDWVILEKTYESTRDAWERRTFLLDDIVPLTDQVQLRFVARDEDYPSLVEAAFDDFVVVAATDTFTGVDGVEPGLPLVTRLEPCRPNPFGARTRIGYSIARPGPVELRVYDVGGRLVRVLVKGRREAGRHVVGWDGRSETGGLVASGVYFAKLTTTGFSEIRRLTVLR
jgi:hypothetical protein